MKTAEDCCDLYAAACPTYRLPLSTPVVVTTTQVRGGTMYARITNVDARGYGISPDSDRHPELAGTYWFMARTTFGDYRLEQIG